MVLAIHQWAAGGKYSGQRIEDKQSGIDKDTWLDGKYEGDYSRDFRGRDAADSK